MASIRKSVIGAIIILCVLAGHRFQTVKRSVIARTQLTPIKKQADSFSPGDSTDTTTSSSSKKSTAPANPTFGDKNDDYRFCIIRPKPQLNRTLVRMKELKAMLPWYQCAGKPYDEFMQKIYKFLETKSTSTTTTITTTTSPSSWGKRTYPIPEGKKILVMGNSHTRQVMTTLLCQYKEQIVR